MNSLLCCEQSHIFSYIYYIFIKLEKRNKNNYTSKNAWKHDKALTLQDF